MNETAQLLQLPSNPGITHVYYHGQCYDGFTAAWIAAKAGIPEQNLHPCLYGGSFKPIPPEGAKVLMVDFAFDAGTMLQVYDQLTSEGGTMIVIDHHKTAQKDLEELPWAYFDMNESGASLAWNFFFPGVLMPRFVRYIREHDLWKFDMPDSKIIKAFIRSYEMTYKNWDEMKGRIGYAPSEVRKEGHAILRAQVATVSAMADHAIIEKIGEYRVPVVNATTFFSEVTWLLLERYKEAPFAAYYMDREDGIRQWGLRSRSDFDCSTVAKRFGGGGHAQAAGFHTTRPDVLS